MGPSKPLASAAAAQLFALWAHTDGKGFNQKLDYLPLNGAEIVVREVDTEAKDEGAGGTA